MFDAVVIGAGPNGLVAATELARHGWSVLLIEAKGRPGGALYSEQLTLPGYVHDVGAAFFPFALASPAFRVLDLQGAGVEWRHGRRDSAPRLPTGRARLFLDTSIWRKNPSDRKTDWPAVGLRSGAAHGRPTSDLFACTASRGRAGVEARDWKSLPVCVCGPPDLSRLVDALFQDRASQARRARTGAARRPRSE